MQGNAYHAVTLTNYCGGPQNMTSCGTIIVDPYDVENDCCVNTGGKIRPEETVEVSTTITNHETEIPVTGDLVWRLVDADTGDVVSVISETSFELDPEETEGFEVTFIPEDYGINRRRNLDYDSDVKVAVEAVVRNIEDSR